MGTIVPALSLLRFGLRESGQCKDVFRAISLTVFSRSGKFIGGDYKNLYKILQLIVHQWGLNLGDF